MVKSKIGSNTLKGHIKALHKDNGISPNTEMEYPNSNRQNPNIAPEIQNPKRNSQNITVISNYHNSKFIVILLSQ